MVADVEDPVGGRFPDVRYREVVDVEVSLVQCVAKLVEVVVRQHPLQRTPHHLHDVVERVHAHDVYPPREPPEDVARYLKLSQRHRRVFFFCAGLFFTRLF